MMESFLHYNQTNNINSKCQFRWENFYDLINEGRIYCRETDFKTSSKRIMQIILFGTMRTFFVYFRLTKLTQIPVEIFHSGILIEWWEN